MKSSKKYSRRHFCASVAALGVSTFYSPIFCIRKPLALPSGTGYAYSSDFEKFENNPFETYKRMQWINSYLARTGVIDNTVDVMPFEDPQEFIKKIHTQAHIDLINSIPIVYGFPLSIGQAAQTAVGYVLGAVKGVCSGSIKNAFCCVRPPGHHVQNSNELGYCCYANVVIAARFARERFNIKKILIVDWDYHQGNGTHGFICKDNDILFFETYRPTMYTTLCDDYIITGPDHIFPENARRINIQMRSGAANDDFARVFENILVPAAQRFEPEFVLISCGFDLKKFDNHGDFNVTAQGVSRITRIVKQIADVYSEGRLVSILEGGYADNINNDETFYGLAACANAHLATLATGDLQTEDPFYNNA